MRHISPDSVAPPCGLPHTNIFLTKICEHFKYTENCLAEIFSAEIYLTFFKLIFIIVITDADFMKALQSVKKYGGLWKNSVAKEYEKVL